MSDRRIYIQRKNDMLSISVLGSLHCYWHLYILEENADCILFETLDFLSSNLDIILIVYIVQIRKRFGRLYLIYERTRLVETFHMTYD